MLNYYKVTSKLEYHRYRSEWYSFHRKTKYLFIDSSIAPDSIHRKGEDGYELMKVLKEINPLILPCDEGKTSEDIIWSEKINRPIGRYPEQISYYTLDINIEEVEPTWENYNGDYAALEIYKQHRNGGNAPCKEH